jgi:hypothetical protein
MGVKNITRCNEDNFKVNTWASGLTEVNATLDSSKLKYRGKFCYQEKNHHNLLFATLFCMSKIFPCSL